MSIRMSIRMAFVLVFVLFTVVGCAPQPALHVFLSPAEPTTAENLTASIETEFGEPAAGSFEFRWHRDGDEQADLNDLIMVPSAQTRRDELWQVVVTVIRGSDDPLVLQSAGVVIVNSPPSISAVVIGPAEATVATALSAEVLGYTDLDGDGPIYSYLWTVDGDIVGDALATLEAGLFARGQVVSVRVTPSDGQDEGNSVLSAPITIGNSAPRAPGIAILPVHPVGAYDLLQCALLEPSTDADSDVLSYEVAWSVDDTDYPGDPIGSGWAGPTTTDLDADTVPAADGMPAEEWTCTLRASDGLAVAETSYSVTLADSDRTVSDFTLIDTNTLSATSGEPVSPRDYLCKVSGWYFGHST